MYRHFFEKRALSFVGNSTTNDSSLKRRSIHNLSSSQNLPPLESRKSLTPGKKIENSYFQTIPLICCNNDHSN